MVLDPAAYRCSLVLGEFSSGIVNLSFLAGPSACWLAFFAFLPPTRRVSSFVKRVDEGEAWDDQTGNIQNQNLDLSEDESSLAPAPVGEVGNQNWTSKIEQARNDPALQKARNRNATRLRQADQADLNILSMYLHSDISSWFPFSVQGPVDVFEPPLEWLEEVLAIARTPCSVPKRPTVKFSCDEKSIDHNTEILRKCDWDMETLFELHRGTTIDHGSEFRPIEQLERVVGRHPNFPFTKDNAGGRIPVLSIEGIIRVGKIGRI
jgi:hypothetical protein